MTSPELIRDLQEVLGDISAQEDLIYHLRNSPVLPGMDHRRDKYLADAIREWDRLEANLQSLLAERERGRERLRLVACEADEL